MAADGEVLALPGFRAFWLADAVSGLGTVVTTLALQVLVVLSLDGTATDVGLLNAARWLPYVLLGLVVGALVDRHRRRPVLIGTDLTTAALLGAVPALWFLDLLTLPVLLAVVAVLGTVTMVNNAAAQSLLPRLLPRGSLLAAHARLGQSSSVVETSGQVVAGALVTALTAPVAVVVDAASYLLSAGLVARIRVDEPVREAAVPSHLRREVVEGLRWVYGHRTLAPLALSTHGWFLVNSVLATVYVPYVLLDLGLSAFQLGVTLAGAGVGGLAGSLVAVRVGLRWGAGRTVVACRAVMPIAWAVVALGPASLSGWSAVVPLTIGQLLYGLALGTETANEMSYQQAVTPDGLQARMNTTIRSVNRGVIVVGAPLGGIAADQIGYRPTLLVALGGFALVAGGLAASPFRRARLDAAGRPA